MIELKFIRFGIPLGLSFLGFDKQLNSSMLDLTHVFLLIQLTTEPKFITSVILLDPSYIEFG